MSPESANRFRDQDMRENKELGATTDALQTLA